MKRPLLWGFFTLSLGIIGVFDHWPVWLLLGAAVLLAIMPFLLKDTKISQVAFVLGLFGFGVVLGSGAFPETDILGSFYEREVSLIGVVNDYPIRTENRLTINLTAREIVDADDENNRFDKTAGIRATVYYQSDEDTEDDQVTLTTHEEPQLDLVPGDLVLMKGKLSQPSGQRNPGGFDYGLYLKALSIEGLLTVKPENIRRVGQQVRLYDRILGIKHHLEHQAELNFSNDVADLLKGVVFGEKNINEELTQSFQDAGVTHVLSVSGLHVGYVFLMLSYLLIVLKINKRHWILFLVPALFFYVALTGFVAPVIRAAIMLLCVTGGQGLHRERDALNQLCLAGIIILFIWPAQLFQAGFQLSMGAMLGIILFYLPLLYDYEKHRNKKRVNQKIKAGPVIQGLVLTFCATVGTLPILLYHFKSFTLMSFLSNLLVVPLIGVFLLAGMIFFAIVAIVPGLAPVISLPIEFLGESIVVMLKGINDLGNAVDFVRISRGGLSLAEMALVLLLVFLFSGYFYLRQPYVRNTVISFALVLVLIVAATPLFPRNLVVTVLDVGQGDSILIETPGGQNYLVDGGGYLFERTNRVADRVLYPVLYAKNIRELDAIFLTHNHVDHSQGVEELIFDGYPVENLFMSVQTNNDELLNQQLVPVSLLKKGSVVKGRDGVTITVYNPDGPVRPVADEEQNNASLVMALSYQNFNLLLCGDVETEVEKQLIAELQAESDERDFQVIKIPHHGSKTSSSLAFLQVVEPEIAVISVGANNSFNHPNDEVMNRLEEEAITALRTDQKGAVEITSNGEFIRIKSYVN
ncbi:DNA internalization-related competence protein ComEC/Rec2 [Acetobacterium sp. UBA5834]|jgi:competence protein ComEC|uniref:DNA internalization-related competence protein ComEC/Rec2 n=1 Tax=Acetobacterium sp. UBA5834 TaxID=1945907 RepID=UPI00257DA802|nr:DNA internalization-related competence protein ComEC/Rec2 [Acetobacterium sp. UBA5834]